MSRRKPLSKHAIGVLRDLIASGGAIAQWRINSGVRRKLYDEKLAYQDISHGVVRITAEGRLHIQEIDKK
jgi:hypothetical protein